MSIKNPSVKFIIFVLMICTFSIGYTEYAVMGILTSIANDFHIQVSSAGLLVTAYAASVCLTGPLVTIISVKLPRKPVLLGLMAIFILSNLMSALAPNFAVLPFQEFYLRPFTALSSRLPWYSQVKWFRRKSVLQLLLQ